MVQEELRRNNRDGISCKEVDEENFSLVGKGKNGKENMSQTKSETLQWGNNKYLSKVKFFNFHEFTHYGQIVHTKSLS